VNERNRKAPTVPKERPRSQKGKIEFSAGDPWIKKGMLEDRVEISIHRYRSVSRLTLKRKSRETLDREQGWLAGNSRTASIAHENRIRFPVKNPQAPLQLLIGAWAPGKVEMPCFTAMNPRPDNRR
jgi:hypothetical protein